MKRTFFLCENHKYFKQVSLMFYVPEELITEELENKIF
jgi:hypothetical protein